MHLSRMLQLGHHFPSRALVYAGHSKARLDDEPSTAAVSSSGLKAFFLPPLEPRQALMAYKNNQNRFVQYTHLSVPLQALSSSNP